MSFITEAPSMTDQVLATVSPWGGATSDWGKLTAAYCAMFEPIYQIVRDIGSPDEPETFLASWAGLLDPTVEIQEYPQYIPFAGMFVGQQVPVGTAPAAAEELVLSEASFKRGQGFGGVYDSSNGSDGGRIVTAAQAWLTGAQNVTLLERWNGAAGEADAYWFTITVRPEQLIDTAGLTSAVNMVKPGGVMWTLQQSDGLIWNDATGVWDEYTGVYATY